MFLYLRIMRINLAQSHHTNCYCISLVICSECIVHWKIHLEIWGIEYCINEVRSAEIMANQLVSCMIYDLFHLYYFSKQTQRSKWGRFKHDMIQVWFSVKFIYLELIIIAIWVSCEKSLQRMSVILWNMKVKNLSQVQFWRHLCLCGDICGDYSGGRGVFRR